MLDAFGVIILSAVYGCLAGIMLPVIIGCITHIQHIVANPGKPDTASGAAPLLMTATVPIFALIGAGIGAIIVLIRLFV